MFSSIDRFLNSLTMYRVVLYGLMLLIFLSLALSASGSLPYPPLSLLASALVLFFACYGINVGLGKLFHTPLNDESSAISAAILFFLFSPLKTPSLYNQFKKL
jgi:hypothetical protein